MTIDFRQGDCRDVLRTLPDKSVHCCVTSPPYFGLRDYGTATWGGGNTGCDHQPEPTWFETNFSDPSNLGGGKSNQNAAAKRRWYGSKGECRRCGAAPVDRQIGLEPSPDEFTAELVKVFREVRRVLRDDGTLWLNLGDSYANGGRKTRDSDGKLAARGMDTRPDDPPGVKPKDLIGIPWLAAFALRADGWYLRQDIIWHKPNPMPESVTDRCTKGHEYIFMLSKSQKYYFDNDAIKEPASQPGGDAKRTAQRKFGDRAPTKHTAHHGTLSSNQGAETRNKRSVWTVAPKPFKEAHFATFPTALIEPCILAGCPVGGTVLDPFGGAGTTGLVAEQHGRNATLIELNPEYIEIARRRIYGVPVRMPWDVAPAFPWVQVA